MLRRLIQVHTGVLAAATALLAAPLPPTQQVAIWSSAAGTALVAVAAGFAATFWMASVVARRRLATA